MQVDAPFSDFEKTSATLNADNNWLNDEKIGREFQMYFWFHLRDSDSWCIQAGVVKETPGCQ